MTQTVCDRCRSVITVTNASCVKLETSVSFDLCIPCALDLKELIKAWIAKVAK